MADRVNPMIFVDIPATDPEAMSAFYEELFGWHVNRRPAGEFHEILGRLPPLEVGIAPQRAEARARGVDQHAVDLAGQAFHLRVALVRKALHVHVRQPGARNPRAELVEPRL